MSLVSCVELSLELPIDQDLEVGAMKWEDHVHFFERTGLRGVSFLTTLLGLAIKYHTPSLLHEVSLTSEHYGMQPLPEINTMTTISSPCFAGRNIGSRCIARACIIPIRISTKWHGEPS